MKITELNWVMKNRHLLDEDDYKILQAYDLFNQYDSGELRYNAVKMLEALGTVIGMYEKYAK